MHPDIFWESYAAGCKQSKRLLEYIEDKFLVQVLERPTRKALLDPVLTNTDKLVKEVKIGGSLGDYCLVEFVISKDMGLAKK